MESRPVTFTDRHGCLHARPEEFDRQQAACFCDPGCEEGSVAMLTDAMKIGRESKISSATTVTPSTAATALRQCRDRVTLLR